MIACGAEPVWHGCYSGSYDLLHPDANAHPAKMAPGLCYRILAHLEELGLLKAGDTVLDPMSGTGMTALVAGCQGYPAVTVELEPKFIELQRLNKARLERKLGRALAWEMIQGDARQLPELLAQRGLVCVTSPPYEDVVIAKHSNGSGVDWAKGQKAKTRPNSYLGATKESAERINKGYGITPGQLGQREGEDYLSAMAQVYAALGQVADVVAIVVKDPTRNGRLRLLGEDTVRLLEASGWHILCHHQAQLFEVQETATLFGEPVRKPKGRLSFFKRLQFTAGNVVADAEHVIGAVRERRGGCVAVTSPPYGAAQTGGGISASKRGEGNYSVTTRMPGNIYQPAEHGSTPGQIGSLPDKPLGAGVTRGRRQGRD